MKQSPRNYQTARQRALMWEHWRKGETLHQIARPFDRHHSSIQAILSESGGIRPTERHRSRSALTLTGREEVSRGIVAGRSIRAIAAALGRAPLRRSNENANGLLRQYLPKGIDLSGHSQSKLNAIARRLDEQTRKTRSHETPAQRFHQAVASTG